MVRRCHGTTGPFVRGHGSVAATTSVGPMEAAVAIDGWGLMASLVPVVVVAGISLARRLGLEKDLLVAVARS